MKKLTSGIGAFLLVFTLCVGYVAVASDLGTREDPVVSLSYINDVLQPKIMTATDKVFSEKLESFTNEIDKKITELSSKLSNKATELQNQILLNKDNADFIKKVAEQVNLVSSSSNPDNSYASVKVTKGTSLISSVGTEMVLISGEAVSLSNGLINLTIGEQSNNKSILKNNLYLTDDVGSGIKANSDITILVRGEYKLS